MNKYFLTVIALIGSMYYTWAVTSCTFLNVYVPNNGMYALDVNGDSIIDVEFYSTKNPFVNNYVIGKNGTLIEVRVNNSIEAKRYKNNEAIGNYPLNDTAYLIINSQGDFAGGSDGYGFIGLRITKNGKQYRAFVELLVQYWEAGIRIYWVAFNDEAGAELRTDACEVSGITEAELFAGKILFTDGNLQVHFDTSVPTDCKLLLFNTAGQVLLSEKIRYALTVLPLSTLSKGLYYAALLSEKKLIANKSIAIY
ncbi:MAG: hypothetical protein KatS3mg031_1973 [Chitinophagales bacterium]|nr:MAG: hypothetical protein KatS3mg031_1973 [Chitinophagales bacterium]